MTQPTPFDAILVQCRDLFRDRVCAAVGEMFDGSEEALTKLAEKADEEHQRQFLDARDLAQSNREVIERQFRTRLTSEFQKRTNQAKKIGQSLSDFNLDDLQLVGEDDLNETLKYNDMATHVRRHCEEELGALDQRVAVLLGDATLEADDNPFGPKVICDAYKQACRQVECPVEVRMAFLKLIDGSVLDAFRSGYQDLNGLLIENSILPKIRYGISKHEGKERPAGAAEEAPAAERTAARGGEDMFAMLSKMIAPQGGAGGGAGGAAPGLGVGGAPLVQGAELMGSLTQLQVGNLAALGAAAAELGPILAEAGNLKNVLHQLKTTSVGAGLGQADTVTLDIVARLFDELFDDPKVHVVLKSLIGRLQLPMLKVAIADKDLFTKKEHPARQLLDTLGQIGMRLPPEFDTSRPLFARLDKFVQELVDGFKEKLEIFDKVRAELEAIIAEDDQRVAREMQATEQQLRQNESLALGKAAAQEEIRKHVVAAVKPPRAVVQFLAQQWIKFMTIVHARDGAQSDAWKGSLLTMDQLLFSVTPKTTPEEQRQFAKTIPGLLKGLKAGMTGAGIEDEVAKAFFGELMKLHTDVMHTHAAEPPPKERKAADPTASTTKRPAPPVAKATDSALKRPVAAEPKPAAEDEELDFTAPVTLNNPFGGGKVDVSADDLDFTEATAALAVEAPPAPAAGAPPAKEKPGAAARPPKKAQTIRLPSAMVPGAWVEILVSPDDETRVPAKLHYVSPMKSHFLFVDRKGVKAYECSRSMLARRIKLGEVTLLDGEPDASLFDRILDGLFGKLRAAAPA